MDTSLPAGNLLSNEQEKRNHLINTLASFSYVAQVPVTYFEDDAAIAWENLREKKFCSYFSSSEDCCRGCRDKLRLARETSANLREPYLFLCNAGMVNIAYPFIVDDTIKGAFFAGPIAMGTDRNSVIRKILENLSYPEKFSPAFITFLSRMETKSPLEISHLHNVFCNCLFSYRILESNFGVVHKDIQKGTAVKTSRFASQSYYPDELPDMLLQSIKTGAVEESLRYFRLFYEKAYLMETGNLNLMKVRLTELFHSLSGKLAARSVSFLLFGGNRKTPKRLFLFRTLPALPGVCPKAHRGQYFCFLPGRFFDYQKSGRLHSRFLFAGHLSGFRRRTDTRERYLSFDSV